MKNKAHRPKQIIKKGWVVYFISARTYFGIPHISQDKKKTIFKNTLFKKAEKYKGKIKHWVVFNNHYHLLVEFENGENLPGFIKETHGATSRLIGKIPTAMLLKENQIFYRRHTAMERRMIRRIDRLWRGLKSAKTVMRSAVAHFSARQKEQRRINSAKTKMGSVVADFSLRQRSSVVADFSLRQERELKFAKTTMNNVVADFSRRLKNTLISLNFSQKTISRLFNSHPITSLYNAFQANDKKLFEVIMLALLPDIPFWCNYYSHIIRNERDFYAHFNYITQNPIKHGVVKNPWDYKFSGLERYDKKYVRDCLRLYPVIDFGGNYE